MQRSAVVYTHAGRYRAWQWRHLNRRGMEVIKDGPGELGMLTFLWDDYCLPQLRHPLPFNSWCGKGLGGVLWAVVRRVQRSAGECAVPKPVILSFCRLDVVLVSPGGGVWGRRSI